MTISSGFSVSGSQQVQLKQHAHMYRRLGSCQTFLLERLHYSLQSNGIDL